LALQHLGVSALFSGSCYWFLFFRLEPALSGGKQAHDNNLMIRAAFHQIRLIRRQVDAGSKAETPQAHSAALELHAISRRDTVEHGKLKRISLFST
jgi:hypothetical protein